MKRFMLRRFCAMVMALGMVVLAMPAQALTLTEAQKLLASDGAASDRLGSSVAVFGDTAVIGADGGDDKGPSTGAAYVYIRDSNGTWLEQDKLLASDGEALARFGYAVAVAGDTAVIGAPWHDDNGADSGSAYVFTRDSSGTWTEQAKLLASDGAAYDYFGYSVAVSGDTAVIGAPYDDDNGDLSGSAYIFTRDSYGTWSEQAKLLASDGAFEDFFGFSVAVVGDTVVIGAPWDDDNDRYSGSAYAFTRNNGTWSQQAKLLASDGAEYDMFGHSLAMAGDTVVIGAPVSFVFAEDTTGSAYVFTSDSNGNWYQQAKLTASDGTVGDHLGYAVAVAGDMAVIGAPRDDDNGADSGSVYVFIRDSNGSWTEQAKLLASDGAAEDYFGHSVAVSNNTAVIGAPWDDDYGPYTGSAYVYSLTPEQQLADLLDDVETLVEGNQNLTGLTGPLNGVSLIEEGSLGDIKKIEAFIRQVEALVRSGQLPESEGTALIDAANLLIQTIQAGQA